MGDSKYQCTQITEKKVTIPTANETNTTLYNSKNTELFCTIRNWQNKYFFLVTKLQENFLKLKQALRKAIKNGSFQRHYKTTIFVLVNLVTRISHLPALPEQEKRDYRKA